MGEIGPVANVAALFSDEEGDGRRYDRAGEQHALFACWRYRQNRDYVGLSAFERRDDIGPSFEHAVGHAQPGALRYRVHHVDAEPLWTIIRANRVFRVKVARDTDDHRLCPGLRRLAGKGADREADTDRDKNEQSQAFAHATLPRAELAPWFLNRAYKVSCDCRTARSLLTSTGLSNVVTGRSPLYSANTLAWAA